MLEFGFYDTAEEIKEVLRYVLVILNGMFDVTCNEEEKVILSQLKERKRKNSVMTLVQDFKQSLTNMLFSH